MKTKVLGITLLNILLLTACTSAPKVDYHAEAGHAMKTYLDCMVENAMLYVQTDRSAEIVARGADVSCQAQLSELHDRILASLSDGGRDVNTDTLEKSYDLTNDTSNDFIIRIAGMIDDIRAHMNKRSPSEAN